MNIIEHRRRTDRLDYIRPRNETYFPQSDPIEHPWNLLHDDQETASEDVGHADEVVQHREPGLQIRIWVELKI